MCELDIAPARCAEPPPSRGLREQADRRCCKIGCSVAGQEMLSANRARQATRGEGVQDRRRTSCKRMQGLEQHSDLYYGRRQYYCGPCELRTIIVHRSYDLNAWKISKRQHLWGGARAHDTEHGPRASVAYARQYVTRE